MTTTAYADETNGLVDAAAYHEKVRKDEDFTLAELAAAGGKITRVRLLTEGHAATRTRWADISYIHGEIDGETVRINLSNCPEPVGIAWPKVKAMFVTWAIREGVNAKQLGLLNEANWSVIR